MESKIEWYKKLAKKLERIKTGEMSLNDYIKEVDAKIESLGLEYVSGSVRFSEREVDFAYLCGVFNASGIDGLGDEIKRLKEIGKKPHDIIISARKQ